MNRYQKIQIENFRGLERLVVDGLSPISLISGRNGVGKTTLLEAIWLTYGPQIPDLTARLEGWRGISVDAKSEFMLNLFHDFNSTRPIVLTTLGDWDNGARVLTIKLRPKTTSTLSLGASGEDSGAEVQTTNVGDGNLESEHEIIFESKYDFGDSISRGWMVQSQVGPGMIGHAFQTELDIPRAPRPQALFHSAVTRRPGDVAAKRLQALEVAKNETKVIKLLQSVEPRLKAIRAMPLPSGESAVFVDIGEDHLMPVALMGDGLAALLTLSLAIATASGGAVLVDEIETGIHHSALREMWQGVATLVREFDVQLFAATHSRETIVAASDALDSKYAGMLSLHRLERGREGQVQALTYDQKSLKTALSAEFEVR